MAITDLNITNQAVSVTTGAINNTDDPVTFAVASGDGDLKFPSTAGGKYFYIFVVKPDKTYEIMRVTSRTGDSLTAVRAQQGSTKLSFSSGAAVEMRLTAQDYLDLIAEIVAIRAENSALSLDLGATPLGQCRFDYVSDTSCVLSRFNGKWLTINGVRREIPANGVPLATTGLLANRHYYVYAYMDGSTMRLEAVSTTHVAGTLNGMRVKSGAPDRTLVGMLATRTDTATFFQSDIGSWVASYFNRRPRRYKARPTSGQTATNLSSAPRVLTNGWVYGMCWDGDDILVGGWWRLTNNVSGGTTNLDLYNNFSQVAALGVLAERVVAPGGSMSFSGVEPHAPPAGEANPISISSRMSTFAGQQAELYGGTTMIQFMG